MQSNCKQEEAEEEEKMRDEEEEEIFENKENEKAKEESITFFSTGHEKFQVGAEENKEQKE